MALKTKVVSMKNTRNFDVRIDRATKWGNPFIIGKHGTRNEVIDKYRRYLKNEIKKGKFSDIWKLHGKTLGCWCDPLPCHGHVLAKYAKIAYKKRKEMRNQ